MRVTVVFAFLLVNYALTHAQMFEQVYPDFEYARLTDGTQWNGDTISLCGQNQMLLLSTDAGKSWTPQMPGLRDWSFYEIEATDDALYLLAEPTLYWSNNLPNGHIATLLRYDPRSMSLDVIEIPRLLTTSGDNPTSVHDIKSADGALFLLQGNDYDGLLLHRSMDGGRSWTEIKLPDSLLGGQSYLSCFDSTHVALLAPGHGDYDRVSAYLSTDAGISWSNTISERSEPKTLRWLSSREIVVFTEEGLIISSTDGGGVWAERAYLPVSKLFDVIAVGSDRGYILGSFGEVYRTDDGFSTFTNVSNNAAGQYLIAGGADTLINVGDQSDNIYVTHDGGISWDLVREAERLFWQIRMASDTVGVALVEHISGDQYFYYRTNDGWKTMTPIMEESHPMFPEYYIGCRVYPVTETLWYLVPPLLPDDKRLVHRSTDGGESWLNILASNDLGDIPMSGGITVVDLPDTSYFGIILERNLVVTSDRGGTWQVTNLLNQSTFSYNMQLRPHASSWMISGDGVLGRDTVWRCASGWDEWEPVLTDPDTVGPWSTFRQIQITPQDDILILAEFDSPLGYLFDWSYIFLSSDDGDSWQLYPTCINASGGYGTMADGSALLFSSPENQTMYNRTRGGALRRSTDGWKQYSTPDVLYQKPYTGWPITRGNAVYICDRYSIFRNLTNGVNGARQPIGQAPGFVIDSQYPHPIRRNEPSYISLRLPAAGKNLRITLHDLLGRTLRELHHGRVDSDNPTVSWNVGALAPGVYIMRTQYGSDVMVKPVLVE